MKPTTKERIAALNAAHDYISRGGMETRAMPREIPEEVKQEQMKQDAEFIRKPSEWPCYPVLHLKTQAWSMPRAFGILLNHERLTVLIKSNDDNGRLSGATENFDSVEQLVERWSVD